MADAVPMFAAPVVVHAKQRRNHAPGGEPLHAALPDDPKTLCGRVAGELRGGALEAANCPACAQWVAYAATVGLPALYRQLTESRERFRCCGGRRPNHAAGCRHAR